MRADVEAAVQASWPRVVGGLSVTLQAMSSPDDPARVWLSVRASTVGSRGLPDRPAVLEFRRDLEPGETIAQALEAGLAALSVAVRDRRIRPRPPVAG